MRTIASFPGLARLSSDDLVALVAAADWIGVDPSWLGAVMQFESGFSPSVRNGAGSGATGLIQFMPSTALGLGTTTDDLAAMTFQQQLEYVKRYFATYRGRLHSLEDTYLAVFYPAFIGAPLDRVLGSAGSPIYDQNSGFDVDHKGYVTKGDITSRIRSVLSDAEARGTVDVPDAPDAPGGPGGGGGGPLASGAWGPVGELVIVALVLSALGAYAWSALGAKERARIASGARRELAAAKGALAADVRALRSGVGV